MNEKTRAEAQKGREFPLRDREGRGSGAVDRRDHPHAPVPALQHPFRLAHPDAAGGRLSLSSRNIPTVIRVTRCPSARRFSMAGIFSSEPERGDIAVFKLPTDDTTDYIKRVIGTAWGYRADDRRSLVYQRGDGRARTRRDLSLARRLRAYDGSGRAIARPCPTVYPITSSSVMAIAASGTIRNAMKFRRGTS